MTTTIRSQLPKLSASALLMLLLGTHVAFAGPREAACGKLFEAKKYEAAARCFAQLVKQPLSPKATKKERFARGRLIRNIALSHAFAARHTKVVAHAAYQRAQAVQWLKRYQREKLYESPRRQKSARKLQEKLAAAIGSTSLTVLTRHPRAQVRIQGYRFDYSGQGKQSVQVRPGAYKVSVVYKGSAPQHKRHKVQPNTPTTLAFAPPKVAPRRVPAPRRKVAARVTKRAKTRPLPRPPLTQTPTSPSQRIAAWSLLGVGLAVAIAGGISYGVGRSSADQSKLVHAKALTTPSLAATEEINDLQSRGAWMMPLGVALFGGAGALLTTGGILLATAPKPPTAKTNAATKKGRAN